MKMQQYTMIFSSATLLLALTSQSSLAFSITGSKTGSSLTKISPNNDGLITVETINLEELSPPRKNSDFMTLLRSDFRKTQGWFFNRSNRNLTNNLIVTDYKPCIFDPQCTIDISQPPIVYLPLFMGAALALRYQPTRFENNLAGDFFWIQRIFTNDSGRPQNQGNTDTYIDNGGLSTPFYPGIAGTIAGQPTPISVFLDAPNRTNYQKNIFWYAELYLVKALIDPNSNRKTVTVYNGVKWGWTSTFTPCAPSSGGGGCQPITSPNTLNEQETTVFASNKSGSNDFYGNDTDIASISGDLLEDPELASEDHNSLASKTKNPDDDALPAEAVPEPTTGLGAFLALGGLGLLKNLKNRKTQK